MSVLYARVSASRARRKGQWRMALKAEQAKVADAIKQSNDGGLLVHVKMEAARDS